MAAPTIYRSPLPGPLTVKYGEKLDIAVTIAGTPLPNVSWFINGRPLLPSSDVKVIVQHKKHSLRIDHVTDDIKSVIVEASNELGSDRRIFSVTVYKVLSCVDQKDGPAVPIVDTERTEGIHVYYHRPRLQLAPIASISSLSLSSESEDDEQTCEDRFFGQENKETYMEGGVNFTVGEGRPPRASCSHSSSFEDSGFNDSGEFITSFESPFLENRVLKDHHQGAAPCVMETDIDMAYAQRQKSRHESQTLYEDNGYYDNGICDTESLSFKINNLESQKHAKKENALNLENNNDIRKGPSTNDENIKFNLTTEYYSSPGHFKNKYESTDVNIPRTYEVQTIRRRVVSMKDGKEVERIIPKDSKELCSSATTGGGEIKDKDTSIVKTAIAKPKRKTGCRVLIAMVVLLLLLMTGVLVWMFAFDGCCHSDRLSP